MHINHACMQYAIGLIWISVCVFVRARVCAAMRGGEQHAQRMQRVRGRVSVRGDEEDREQNDREKNGKQP